MADYLTFEQTLRQSAAIIAATNQLLNRIYAGERLTDELLAQSWRLLTDARVQRSHYPESPRPGWARFSARRRLDVEPMMASVREADWLVSREV